MKIKNFWIAALFAAGVLTLAGCGNSEANPTSYCEANGWTLKSEEGSSLCMFDDGSYCGESAFESGECVKGDIFYNTIDDIEQKTDWNGSSDTYSDEELQAAVDTIMNVVDNEWEVKVEMQELFYIWPADLDFCKSLNSEIDECIEFSSNFYIPAQDTQMAGPFEPDTTLTGYGWTLGRATAGEWRVLTNGFG